MAATITLSDTQSNISLDGLFLHRTDPGGQLDADDLLQADTSSWDSGGAQSFGYTRDVHWFRLTLLRPAGTAPDWILTVGRPYMDDVRIYVDDGHERHQYRHGDHLEQAARPLSTRLFSQPLRLAADRPITVLIRTQTTSATAFTAILSRPLAFAVRQGHEGLLLGTFYGALIIVILFHFSIGSWISDRTHIFYALFASCQLVSYLFINGFGQILFDFGWPALSDRAINISNFSGCAFGLLLWMDVLQMRTVYPRFYRPFQAAVVGFLASSAIAWGSLYTVFAPWSFMVMTLMTTIALGLSADLLRRGPRTPTLWFYVAAFSVAVGGLGLHMAALLGAMPLYWLPENLFQISAIGHILLLSIGLVYRVRHLDRERGQAREEAISASARADGQRSLVGMLSHEFRTPLAMIHSASQMIRFREDDLAEGSRERLERIEETSRRLSALIDVFLASDALDQGKLVLSPRQGEIAPLVEQVLTQFGAQARRIQIASFPPMRLTADHDLLAVALRNCLANALNYSPPHSPVWLRLADEGEMISISVEDEGPGIAADELEMLGTPYFRGRHGLDKPGSGLGISMVRTIIKAHGGVMQIHSVPGAGTRVTLRLPEMSCSISR